MLAFVLSFFCLVDVEHRSKLAHNLFVGCEEVITWENAWGQPRAVILHCPDDARDLVQVDSGWVDG